MSGIFVNAEGGLTAAGYALTIVAGIIVSGGVLFRGETFRKEKDEHKAARILRGGDGAGLHYILY